MEISAISAGQTYEDEEGAEVTVYQVHRSRGLVVLEGEDGRFEMTLDDFAQAIEDGDFDETADAEAEDGAEEENQDEDD